MTSPVASHGEEIALRRSELCRGCSDSAGSFRHASDAFQLLDNRSKLLALEMHILIGNEYTCRFCD